MQTEQLIPVNEFCTHCHIEASFINSLQQFGLIEITMVKETPFIPVAQLQQVEKLVHLYYELDINLEGIDAINHLLQRINDMRDEIRTLKNKLLLYENE